MLGELPIGWETTTLGEIVELSRERVLPIEVPNMRYVGLEHIEPHTMKLLGHGYARETRSSSVRFSKGDVLYGRMRPYLNKVWVAEFGGICSAEFLVFSKTSEINSLFLGLRVNAEDFVSFATSQVSGDRPRVDFEKLSHFSISLPPLAEQDRIATKLRSILEKMERAKAATHRAQGRLQRYRSSILNAAATGELTRDWRDGQTEGKGEYAETGQALLQQLLTTRYRQWEVSELQRQRSIGKAPKDESWKSRYRQPTPAETTGLVGELPPNWTWASIDQLSWNSGYGTSVKCTYEAKGPAVLRIPNIRHRTLDFSDLKFATNVRDLRDEDFVAPGDFLLIRTNGSKDIIGRAAVVNTRPNTECSFASYLIRFRLIEKEEIWNWVTLAWDSPFMRIGIEGKAVTTAGQYNLSLTRLNGMAIPLPPLVEQRQIIQEVERRLAAADLLAATLESQIVRAHATRHALLLDAFSGRLVIQQSSDESATVLLERLQASRHAEKQKPKAKRMPKAKSRTTGVTARRNLLDFLKDDTPMTPEELFHAAGYSQDSVDEFFADLRELTTDPPKVIEERKDGRVTLLRVIS
jgi:type I restriction enzyme S subunit